MRAIITSFLLLIAFVAVHAQNNNTPKIRYALNQELKSLKEDKAMEVRISQYNFRKIDKNHRVVEFTPLDAIRLESYFIKQKNVMACETHALDKTATITTPPDFDHKAIIPELEKMGYLITGLRSSLDNMTFAAKGSCQDKDNNAITNNSNSDCHDCGKQEVQQSILDKFKDADYGGSTLINFDLDKPKTPAVITSVASDQNN